MDGMAKKLKTFILLSFRAKIIDYYDAINTGYIKNRSAFDRPAMSYSYFLNCWYALYSLPIII